MFHYFEAITNTSGDSLIGYFARVVDPATQNTVTISADDNGTPIVTVSGVENAATTDQYGNLDFYVVPGTYHLDIYAPNATSLILRVQNVSMNSTKGDTGDQGPQGDPGEGLADVMAPNGAGLVGFVQNSVNAVTRDLQSKAREWVSIKDFGAVGAPADDTAAIQAAYNSGASLIIYPPGEYLHKALTITTPYQRHYGPGAKLTRTQANTSITIANAARGVHLVELRFGVQTSGMAGDNIIVNAPDFRWLFCESRDCAGIPLHFVNCGGGMTVIGGVLQTANQTASGWDMKVEHDTGRSDDTLYGCFSGVITNQDTGGFWFTGKVGTMSVNNQCQFGKLRMDNGGSSRISHSRINNDATILSGFATFTGCNLNGQTVFGQAGQPNIGSICFDNTNVSAVYGSLTINSNVIQSSFELGQIASAGTPVTINSYNNDISLDDIPISIGLGAGSGSPSLGDATYTARMSCHGRRRQISLSFQAGGTTNFGSNAIYFTIPVQAKRVAVSQVIATAQGRFWDFAARIRPGEDRVYLFPSSGLASETDAAGTGVTGAYPVSLAGSLIEVDIAFTQN